MRSSSVRAAWPAYFGIIALLVLIVMALAGGIIWYNLRKSTELMLASAEREMVETGEKISDRIKLLYDPLICDRRHRLSGGRDQDTAQRQWPPSDGDAAEGAALLPADPVVICRPRERRFFGVTHIAGESRARFRGAFKAPKNAAFANKIVTSGKDGARVERWVFLDDDGVEVGRSDDMPPEFDPRQRP